MTISEHDMQNNWGYYKILNMTKLNPENILLPGIGWSWGS